MMIAAGISARGVIDDFRVMMCIIAYVIFVYAWIEHTRKKGFDIHHHVGFLVYNVLLIAAIAYSEQITFGLAEAIQKAIGSEGTLIDGYLADMARCTVSGSFSDYLTAELVGFIFPAVRLILFLVMKIMEVLQSVMLVIGYALCPMFIAFLALPLTRNIGVKFLMSIFSVMLWPIGFAIAELSFFTVLDAFVKGLTNAQMSAEELTTIKVLFGSQNLGSDATLSIFLAIIVIVATIFLIAMYVIAPMLITILLNGASPAGMLSAGVGATLMGTKMAMGGVRQSNMGASALGAVGAAISTAGSVLQSAGRATGYDNPLGALLGTTGLASRGVGVAAKTAGKVGETPVAQVGKGGLAKAFTPAAGPMMGLSRKEVEMMGPIVAPPKPKKK